jgi:hypothetical protein
VTQTPNTVTDHRDVGALAAGSGEPHPGIEPKPPLRPEEDG